MLSLFKAERWFKIRDESLDQARKVRDTLTDPEGYWAYSPNDERVKKAMSYWLERARDAQAKAMGREPVIPNMIVIGDDGTSQGPLYADRGAS